MSTDQLSAAETFTLPPRQLEAAILAGRCDALLDLRPAQPHPTSSEEPDRG